ncbi:argininosuccinate synthase [Sulfobacillus thermosulfidooxidans]|uniref:argininosuccinate synthase n=1 Tax=Sulfobacillus thermosulfidooxidans TaxID=28034 RepID=UPI0006B4AEF9|nr:argininosuccinate synthase [Sulfobacillus thermosulfidooxidans]
MVDGIHPHDTVVLAYSGGLDTSIIIPWLKENYGVEVVAFCADLGQGEDLNKVRDKAFASGAKAVVIKDLRQEFLTDYAFPMLKSQAIYENVYLLGTAIARPLIAKHLVEVAREYHATAVAHGATGKGNDQVRFELGVMAWAPDLKVIAPWREWHITGRNEAMAYAKEHNIPVSATPSSPYSRDQNLWHISHEGGVLEDPSVKTPPDVYTWTTDPLKAPNTPEWVRVRFEKGVPVAINGEEKDPVDLMQTLNQLGAKHGIGRVTMVENRLVGMKSRGVYETPGGTILYTAHQGLTSLTWDRETQAFAQTVALRMARLIYDGFWFSALRESLMAFVNAANDVVSGEVDVMLYKGCATVHAMTSPFSLYSEDLATFDGGQYNHHDAEGFIHLFGLPLAVRQRLLQQRGDA